MAFKLTPKQIEAQELARGPAEHILFEGGSDSRDRIAESRNGMSFKTIERDYELVYGNQNDRHTFSRLC